MSKEKLNRKAWEILNADEKAALSLSLGHGKSSWESGEIIGKVHFKYLEIQKRAQKFLEIFTNHFEKYGGLIPSDLEINFSFIEFLQLTMLERNNISTTTGKMDSKKYLITSMRSKYIRSEMGSLKNSPKESAEDLFHLIMDFDRWNNFRILPIELQEPSAFKRRNKARNIKHIKNITNLPKFSVLRLVEIFSYSGKYPKCYLPIISKEFEDGYKIVQAKGEGRIINKITNIGLFLFDEKSTAEEFAKLIHKYFMVDKKTCVSGQKFWPKFRDLMAKAINHKELENIHKSRTYLDNAIFNEEEKAWVKNGEK